MTTWTQAFVSGSAMNQIQPSYSQYELKSIVEGQLVAQEKVMVVGEGATEVV